jgi:hypothetical protein
VSLPRIFFEGGSWLVWRADDISNLQSTARVLGTPSMTAPAFPQQSAYLALPVELMPCEAKWCHDRGLCAIVVARFHAPTQFAGELPKSFKDPMAADCPSEYDTEPAPPPDVPGGLYRVCSDLRARGLWVCDGANYGADFTVYRSVPGHDHSFALVWADARAIDTRKLIQYVRVAEASRKRAVLAIAAADIVRYVDVARLKSADEAQRPEPRGDASDETE